MIVALVIPYVLFMELGSAEEQHWNSQTPIMHCVIVALVIPYVQFLVLGCAEEQPWSSQTPIMHVCGCGFSDSLRPVPGVGLR